MSRLFPDVELEKQDDNECSLKLDITADLNCFEGHFPDAPVLAGVVQLDWVVKLCRQYYPDLVEVTSVEVLKFQRIVTAGEQLTLVLQRKSVDTLLFNYSAANHQVSSGRLKWSVLVDG